MGGVRTGNLRDYLALPWVAACGGSWMVAAEWIDAGNWAEVTRLTREALVTAAGEEVKK